MKIETIFFKEVQEKHPDRAYSMLKTPRCGVKMKELGGNRYELEIPDFLIIDTFEEGRKFFFRDIFGKIFCARFMVSQSLGEFFSISLGDEREISCLRKIRRKQQEKEVS